ncbi:hypothetical protein CN463_18080 [Bacillus cereus]|uniref:hypothetical protein n=1 Tax=Bacillus cereus TaxID=1396 RepID=UPI000BF67764|nr:hypothetical protein [Bacillus cereus]PEX60637.1 hypothetical protein CN463_18080 [Bacillus cereus]
MFFSNSTIIVRINNMNIDTELRDFSLFEKNDLEEYSRKFYSINFYDNKNDRGEIHYTNSFEYGKMNVINFIRKSNLFFLFTSSVQHSKFFKKIMSMMLDERLEFEVLKIPLVFDNSKPLNIKNFAAIQVDSIFGIIGTLMFENNPYLIKVYNNGVITFPFTNNKQLIEEVMSTSLEILRHYGEI